jgi:hypothetical protein
VHQAFVAPKATTLAAIDEAATKDQDTNLHGQVFIVFFEVLMVVSWLVSCFFMDFLGVWWRFHGILSGLIMVSWDLIGIQWEIVGI